MSALAPEGDLSSYVSNVEWEVTGVPVVRHELIYGCCPEPFPDVTFYIQVCYVLKVKCLSNDQELVQSEPVTPSNPKWETAKITNKHNTKRPYG